MAGLSEGEDARPAIRTSVAARMPRGALRTAENRSVTLCDVTLVTLHVTAMSVTDVTRAIDSPVTSRSCVTPGRASRPGRPTAGRNFGHGYGSGGNPPRR